MIGCCVVVVVLGGGHVILDPSCIAPGPSLPLWPLTFVALSSVPWPLPLRGVCPLVTCSCCSGDDSCCLLAYLHTPHSPSTLPNHRRPHDDPPHYCPLPPFCQPGRSPRPSTWVPSLRAAKMAKAAAAVANSSSSPVKELRDLSAMDAFRSRSISVSEHAVRRLEKILTGNQTKKNNNNPNTCYFPPWDGWWGVGSLSCGSVGWFVARETPGEGGACWRKFCVSTFLVCFGLRSYACCFTFSFYDLLLHAVFAADIRKYLMFLHLILL